MRRVTLFLLVFVTIFSLAVSAGAVTSVSSLNAGADVFSDGSCQISLKITLRLEQPVSDLTFPVPKDAASITLNGQRVRTQVKNEYRLIDLSKNLGSMAGEFTFIVGFSLPDVIGTSDADLPQLQIPLLSGFGYPIEKLDFTVNLPGKVDTKPAFSSGYYQAGIEKSLTYTFQDTVIKGTATKALMDHETLTMTLIVPEGMFHQNRLTLPDLQALSIAMAVCALLAVLYWLLTMRCKPLRITACPTPPEGCTAGEMGSVLTLEGADLSMMVFSWAQLGYLTIQLDRHDRVKLHKQMDMGNERGEFERRCFRLLFGAKAMVDTRSSRYADLCLKVKKMTPSVQSFLHHRSGNPRLFRFAFAAVGLFGGAALGIRLSADSAAPWLWAIVLSLLGAYSAYKIQSGAYRLFLRDKHKLWTAGIFCLIWIVLGYIAGTPGVGILVSASQLLAGLMAAHGGRRTDAGRQICKQALGLRRYLRKADPGSLRRIWENDPDYFFTLAPYALALGVDKTFAHRFGKLPLSPCPYLITGASGQMTAAEWCVLMRRTVDSMESGVAHRRKENLRKLLRSLRK